jgi:voltage-gated potassium channel
LPAICLVRSIRLGRWPEHLGHATGAFAVWEESLDSSASCLAGSGRYNITRCWGLGPAVHVVFSAPRHTSEELAFPLAYIMAMAPTKRLQLAGFAVLGVIAFGGVGFKLVMGWPWFDCFYFTVITITTIGYGEPAGMNQHGRYFTVILILVGVGTIGYALTAAARAVLEFELVSAIGRRKMYKDITKLSGHYIVCGCGRMGVRIVREMEKRGAEFVIIESDEGAADRLLSQGYLVLMGDATTDEVLKGAGIERARGLVCAVTSDPNNLYITLAARDLNKDLFIVARASDEAALNRLLKAGANKVVSPVITGSNQMAQMLLKPAVADFIELATMTDMLELEIEQIEVRPTSPFIGRALRETNFRTDLDVIIIAIKRSDGEMIFNPSADTMIKENDALVALGSHTNLEMLERYTNVGSPAVSTPPSKSS